MKPQDIEEIAESESAAVLTAGATFLTATSHQAVDWKYRLVSTSANRVCETPRLFSWQAWLNQLAADHPEIPVVLNRIQETRLWEQVIKGDLPDQSAASVRGLAAHARDAFVLMQEYRIDVGQLYSNGEEAAALARWIVTVRKKLNRNLLSGRILSADLGQHLLLQIRTIVHTETILLAGFDSFTPLQQQLMKAIQESGVRLLRVKPTNFTAEPVLYACNSERDEYLRVAVRIKAVLKTAPLSRIVIATSNAISDLPTLKRVLDEVLMPEARLAPFFSLQSVAITSDSLADAPMIRQLLQLLFMAGECPVALDTFSMLLFSPWLRGYEIERTGRARLDARFRQQNCHRITYNVLLHSASLRALPELLAIVRALEAWKKDARPALSWVKAVHEFLKTVGFMPSGQAGEAVRSSHEIRQMNAFHDSLVSLVSLDVVDKGFSWPQFLSLLRTVCSEMRFAPMAKYTNVVVMPLAQITALSFDYLFVLGLDEEAFPPPARLCPLLPASVQKSHAIPMSSGVLAYASSQQLWIHLLQSAPSVEISYARHRDDREFLPSSFVMQVEQNPVFDPNMEVVQLPTEYFNDAPNVSVQSDEAIRGGTSIIRNQSACPFRAFATHRLSITRLDETSPGIEPRRKGDLIHIALDFIWKKLDSQQALTALGADGRNVLIDAAIGYAWSQYRLSIDARTQQYERKRMRALLLEWLELELSRPPFRVIGSELDYLMQLPEEAEPQFLVRIKIDRMDQDESGHRILIDYKTGAKQTASSWLQERIEEPQLPQYALAAGLGSNDAVAFARVRSGDMNFEGLCGEEIGIRGVISCDGKRHAPEDWQQLLKEWQVRINALAAEFVSGRCDVSPRDVHSCKYCGFEAICRIEEIGIETETNTVAEA